MPPIKKKPAKKVTEFYQYGGVIGQVSAFCEVCSLTMKL